MATLQTRLDALATAIGTDVKALTLKIGDLSSLTTVDQDSIVDAINEIVASITSGGVSPTDLSDAISDLRDELRAGAGAALDTFLEVEAALAADASTTSALATAIGNRVRFDAAQTLTSGEKLQARQNIDAYGSVELGDPDTNLVTIYVTAKT